MVSRTRTQSLDVAYVVSMASGLHSFVYREIRELANMGVKVHLFPTKSGAGSYVPLAAWPVHRPGVLNVITAHARWLLRLPGRYIGALLEAVVAGAIIDFVLGILLADTVERNDIRVVHCHFGDHKLFIGHFSERLTGRPLTVTIHAYELYNNPNPRMFRRALQTVATVVTVSEYNRQVLLGKYGVPVGKVQVIPLFADLPERPVSTSFQRDQVIILTVARLVEKKGHDTLIEALRRLPSNYELWIVGSGTLDVRGLAEAAGVSERVRLLGHLTDEQLQDAYRGASLFCLPSRTTSEGDREGIPVALMEAMAYQLPVVATRHAGVPELVEETLVDEGDVEALATALLRLGQDPSLRILQGQRNRQIVSTRFSPNNVLLLKALFDRLAAQRENPPTHSREELVSV